jgi:4-alpha-glucanotransferase
VNVPGTSTEYSNWTRRMTASAKDIFARPEVRAMAAALVEARKVAQSAPRAGARS